MSGEAGKTTNGSTPGSALTEIAKNLRKPPLLFALGALVVLLMAAGITSDNQAPLYVGAIVVVAVVALLIAGRPQTKAVGGQYKAGGGISIKDSGVANREFEGSTAQDGFSPVFDAGKDLIIDHAQVGNTKVTPGPREKSSDPSDPSHG